MAESVLTNTDANFQAFRAATTYAQQRAQAAENARAAIAGLIPDAQAAANAKADALLAAGAKPDALLAAGAKTNALAAAALLPDLRAARLAATATAGLIAHEGGDHTTIPVGAGVYRIMTGMEVGQVWERVAGGGVLRRPELETAAAADVQATQAVATEVQTKTAPAVAALADTFGGRTFAGVRTAIQAGANQLADADYPADGTPLTLTPANPLRGRGRKLTRLTTQAGVTPAGPVLVDLGSVTDSDPTKPHSGVTLEGLTIADTAQTGGAGVGLLWRGSHRTVRDVTVRGFYGGGSAVQFDAANTYCATLDTFDLFDGSFGVTLPANPNNSGERIAFTNGSIFNVQTSCLRILGEGWFVKLHNVSLDYPGVSAIQAGAPLSVDMQQCHLEWSAPGQPHLPLVSSTAGCVDFGIITLTGCDLVHFVTGNLTFPDLIGPGLQRGTVILRDCLVTWVDGGNVRRQRVTRAFTHHVPFGGAAPVGGVAYQNDTAAALRLVLRVTLPAGGSWAAYTGDTSGTGNMAAFVNSASSAAEHTVTVDVPAGHYYKLSSTAALLRSEFLA